ncbi:protein FAM149A-like [Pollicipes pollicipes]|uniref:protein FAM149A-like n=1 Tax=Pollicipes pollicipes TaxID=41117 RepID=UPI00188542D3|nr:protein FAM149A-like [Pollicipes pollicipes]
MSFSRRNVEKLGFSRPPPDAENDDSGLGFLRDDIGSATTDGDLPGEEPGRTQSVMSLLSWGDDEFERESTLEVERMLESVDRLLFEGEQEKTMAPALVDECRLWSKRFPHFRVVGRRLPVLPSRPPDRAVVRVTLLTEDGPVDEESAACLRSPGREETLCEHGSSPAPTAGSAPAEEPPAAAAVTDPTGLVTEMVTNSLVSLLWADYVRTMTPVFQLGAESAEALKLTSVSREASARARP